MIFFGQRPYGRIKVADGLDIETMFFHVFWLPLIPYRGLITYQRSQSVKSRIRMPSVLAGYGRVWGPLLLLFSPALVMEQGPALLVLPVVGIVLAAVGWLPQFRTLDEPAANEVQWEFGQILSSSTPAPTPPAPGVHGQP